MNGPKPTDAQLRSMLNMTHFGSDHGPLAPSDPMTAQGMQLSIERIDFYDRNPRHVRNTHYEEIKESIRTQGMQQPLVVTRRPGSERYMLRFGGNTRLAILREFFAETGDKRFEIVNCEFKPWTDETDVLVGHLIENETRGELTFIDKARAVRDTKLLIEAASAEPVSKRQLAELLKDRGYRVDAGQITWYDYALDVLVDAIPNVFAAGIGRPQVRRLRQLDAAAEIVWKRRQLGTLDVYRRVFGVALSTADDPNWDFEYARKSVESALANRANAETRHITLELGVELDDTRIADDDRPQFFQNFVDGPIEPASAFEPAEQAAPAGPAVQPLKAPSWQPPDTIKLRAAADPAVTNAQQQSDPTIERPAALRPPAATEPSIPAHAPASVPEVEPERAPATWPSHALDLSDPDEVRSHLRALREALGMRGRHYAHLAGLDDCIRTGNSEWLRLGYLVVDFPDAKRCEQARSDERKRQVLAASWWELALCCDLCLTNEHIVRNHPDPADADEVRAEVYGAQSRFVAAWRSLQTVSAAIRASVGLPDPFGFSDYVDAASTELWDAGMALRQAYHDIRAFAARAGIDLVGDPWAEVQ